MNLNRINAMAQPFGLIPVFISGDESTDDEIRLMTASGLDTNIHVQVGPRYYGANEWFPDEEAMAHGKYRRTLVEAFKDALALYAKRSK